MKEIDFVVAEVFCDGSKATGATGGNDEIFV